MGKLCRLCGRDRPIEEFYKAPGTVDGRRGECRECFQQQRRERIDARPERAEQARERTRRWQLENPERYAAQRQRKSRPARRLGHCGSTSSRRSTG
jgi:hypothetical protein